MTSRMGKYYRTNTENNNRTSKNQKLYETLYSDNDYDDIDNAVTKPLPDKIDIEKIRELLKKDEDKNSHRTPIIKEPVLEYPDSWDEDKNYDIRDILDKARVERESEPTAHRSIKNTDYNISKGIKVDEYQKQMEEDAEELKELINTITSTSLLNKMGDRELSLELLNDLRSNTMIGESESIKALIEEETNVVEEETKELDKSFYTSSMNLLDKDLVNLDDINTSIEQNNRLITIVLVVLIVVIVMVTAYVFFNLLLK
ncbi:MAG: hypothetical protein PHO63_04435 [Bacilli bacterium]|nr:hypothetical protein [Bacilli bacterium]MDD4809298.1 hypothetical protein [Bacilli bacterium]